MAARTRMAARARMALAEVAARARMAARAWMALAEVAGAGGRGAGGGWLCPALGAQNLRGALPKRRRVGPASESAPGRPRLPGHKRGPTHPVTVAPPRHRVHSRGSCGPRSLWILLKKFEFSFGIFSVIFFFQKKSDGKKQKNVFSEPTERRRSGGREPVT